MAEYCLHHHGHGRATSQNRLGIALWLTAGYMLVEAVGGLVFNSLALLADAGHMLSDVMALGFAWLAIGIGNRSANDRLTFGFKRTEVLVALFNGLALWAIVAVIFYEAALRLSAPGPVEGSGLLVIALVGLALNLAVAVILFSGRDQDLNLRGAFLHAAADALGATGAIVAGVVIVLTGRYWVDPLVSLFIGMLVLYSSWGLVRESVHILMEGVPSDLDIRDIETSMMEHEGVCCVYDLHIWSISTGHNALSAHVVMSDPGQDRDALLAGLRELVHNRFRIDHTTIQLETTHDMRSPDSDVFCREGTTCAYYPPENGRP